MSRFVIALVVGIFTMLININVKADPAPAAWHCASQSECVALLTQQSVKLYRNQILKGEILNMGSGDGIISASEGWLIVTRNYDNNVYLMEVATGVQFTVDMQERCYHGLAITNSGNPMLNFVVVSCPANNYVRRISLFDFSIYNITMMGNDPRWMTRVDDRIYVFNHTGGAISNFGVDTWSGGSAFTGHNAGTSLVGTQHGLFFTDEDAIWFKPHPLSDGNATAFYQLSSPTVDLDKMATNGDYIYVSGTSGGQGAYLIEIDNPTNVVNLDVLDPEEGAMSADTIWAIQLGGAQVTLKAYDMTGTPKYELLEPASGVAYAAPTLPPECGNGLTEPGEICDASDLDGQTCQNQPEQFDAGELTCNQFCGGYDAGGCYYICGNNSAAPGEECDGQDLRSETCVSQGYVSGFLSCTASCEYDFSLCEACGNDVINSGELCDGSNTGGQVCQSLGFTGGTLSCGNNCDQYDTSNCSTCGNGTAEGAETCDGLDLKQATCASLNMGFTQGTLSCYGNCQLNVTQCVSATCGNGTIDPGEECDDGEDNSNTISGACRTNCRLPTCGDNVIDPGETCDDGDRVPGDGCSEFCGPELVSCGNGSIETGETCDGTNFAGQTCQSLGFSDGGLSCRSDCQLDASQCRNTWESTDYNVFPYGSPDSGDFTSGLAELYAQNTASPNTQLCEQTVSNGDLIITSTTGHYCNVVVTMKQDSSKRLFVHLYKPANSLNDEDPFIRFYADGRIAVTRAGSIKSFRGFTGSILVNENLVSETPQTNMISGLQFLSVHPDDSAETGRFMVIDMGNGIGRYCATANTDVCAVIPGGQRVVIDLDDLEDSLGDIGRTPKKSGCSVTGSSSQTEIPVFIAIMLLLLAFRSRRRRRG